MSTVDGQRTPGGSPSSQRADLKLEAVVVLREQSSQELPV
jgi:hypothetical protein